MVAARAGFLGGGSGGGAALSDGPTSAVATSGVVSDAASYGPVGVAGVGYGLAPSSGFGLFAGEALASSGGVVGSAPVAVGRPPRVHEVHTHSSRPVIRLEEYTSPGQIVRVHEGPQAPPQVVKVQVPSEQQDIVRVVSKGSGPAHVERVLHQARGAQVIDVRKPGPAPVRVVQVVRGPAPPPRVEFVQEPDVQNQVYVAHGSGQATLASGPVLGDVAVATNGIGPAVATYSPGFDGFAGLPAASLSGLAVASAPVSYTAGHVVAAGVSAPVASAVSVPAVAVAPAAPIAEAYTDGSGILEPRSYPVPTRQVNRW